MQNEVKNGPEARRVFERNCTPRYCSLDILEAYVEGRQYEGRPHWFNDNVPLLDRGPHIVEPIVDSAIKSYQDLIFGEGKFPQVTAKVEEDDTAFDPRFGLEAEDSKKLDHLIRAAFKQANVAQVSREALARALGSRTAVGIVSIKGGKLCVELVPAKCCKPEFHPKYPGEVIRLDIMYPYIEQYRDTANHCYVERCMMFRRVIDADWDTTYQPVRAREDGEPPNSGAWTPDLNLSVNHSFGFCPVVWFPFRKIATTRHDFDGIAIHERYLDELDAFNRSLSQRDRAGLYAGDPMQVEIGVGEDENPSPIAPQAADPRHLLVDSHGRIVDSRAKAAFAFVGTQTNAPGGARKRGVGVVARYGSPNAKVEYLTLPGEALKPLDDDIDKKRSLLAEGMSWVRPLEAGSSNTNLNISRLSSKTLALLFKRQTSACDLIRPDAWNGWLYPLTNLLLRIIYLYASDETREGLYLGGLDVAKKLLQRFDAELSNGEKRWFAPALTPVWGDYFPPDEADRLALSQLFIQDYEAGFITLRKVLELRKNEFGIDNIDAFMEQLTKEVEQRKQEESDRVVEEATAIHKAAEKAKPKTSSSGG